MKQNHIKAERRDVILTWTRRLDTARILMAARILSLAWAFPHLVKSLDPRIVRLRDPASLTERVFSFALIGVATVVGIAVLTSLIKDATAASRENQLPVAAMASRHPVIPQNAMPITSKPMIAKPSVEEPTTKELVAKRIATSVIAAPTAPTRHPRFYDPILIFTEQAPQQVSAYPLSDPPGVVVDIKGLHDTSSSAQQAVGEDDRIQAVRVRAAEAGIRYIVRLTTPINRIEIEFEGRVIMVYPTR